MNWILVIIRYAFTLPVFGLEWVLKGLAFVLTVILTILYGIFAPLSKRVFEYPEDWWIYKYATQFRGKFYITDKVWDLWE